MSSLKTWFRPARLRRITLVLISSLFLFVSTACSSKPPLVSTDESAAGTQGQDINLYDSIQEPKGGMNNYDDTLTTGRSVKGAIRAKALIDNSKRIDSTTDNTVLEAVKDIPEGAEAFASNAKSSIATSAKSLKESVKDYPAKTQRNLDSLGDYAQDKAENAIANAQDSAQTAAARTQDRAADLKENVEDLAS